MIGHYSPDELEADNRHLQCQLNKEKAVVKHLESRIRDLEEAAVLWDKVHSALSKELDAAYAALNDTIIEKDELWDEAEAGFQFRDARIRELEDELSELEDAAHYCVGKGRLDDALEEWRTLNKINRR